MAPRQSRKSQSAAQAPASDEDYNTKQDSQDAEIEVMKRARGMVVDVSISESHITIVIVLISIFSRRRSVRQSGEPLKASSRSALEKSRLNLMLTSKAERAECMLFSIPAFLF